MMRHEPSSGRAPRRGGAARKVAAGSESGYWELQIAPRFQWRDLVWVNDPDEDAIMSPVNGFPIFARSFFGNGKGFSYFEGKPTPRFRVGYKEASQLGDACFYAGDAWLIISRPLAELLQSFQPDGVAVLPIEVELEGGAVLSAGEFLFFDVTFHLPAFDVGAMNRRIVDRGLFLNYEPELAPPYILRKDIPQSANLFRDEVIPGGPIFATHAVREACRSNNFWRRLRWKNPAARF